MGEIKATAGAHNTKFFYGPNRSRYQREDRDHRGHKGAVIGAVGAAAFFGVGEYFRFRVI